VEVEVEVRLFSLLVKVLHRLHSLERLNPSSGFDHVLLFGATAIALVGSKSIKPWFLRCYSLKRFKKLVFWIT
jgi:hypothetical protein